jgi:hypothetical protein
MRLRHYRLRSQRHEWGLTNMSAITFGRGVPAFGRAAVEGFGKKGGEAGDQQSGAKNRGAGGGKDGLLDTVRTVLEAANDFRDEATAEVCRRVIEASTNGRQPTLSDLRIINNYFK